MSNSSFVPIKNSITTQLLVVVFSLYVIFAITVTLTHMIAEYYNTKKGVKEDLITFQETFEQGLATQVYNFDDQAVSGILRGMIKIPVIEGVTVNNLVGVESSIGLVVDAKGAATIISEDGSHQPKKKSLFFSQLISHAFTLYHIDETGNKHEAGTCVIYSSESVVFIKVRYGFIFILANAVLKTIALWLIFLYIGQKILSHPLSELTRRVKEIDLDRVKDQNISIKTKGRNELKILEEVFNSMLQNLDSARAKRDEFAQGLKENQECLEKMVDERTNELLTAKLQLIETEKMAALGQLVIGVAHEINTPMGICITSTSLLQDLTQELEKNHQKDAISKKEFECYLSKNKEITEIIMNNIRRTANLAERFQGVAINQSGEQKQIFKLKPYIDDVCLSLSSNLKQYNHCIEISCNQEIEAEGYPIAFTLVISNLIMNSITHGFKDKEGKKINIEVNESEENILIIYKDNGIGIEKENISKLFEPFFTTNMGGNSGLGMHIIYNIITQQFEGYIQCKSEVNKGVIFTISIPRISTRK